MKNRFFIVPLVALLGLIGHGLPAYSQAMPDHLQQILDETNDLIRETNQFLEEVVYPQVRSQQAHEAQLSRACTSGNSSSCTELQGIEQRRLQWMIANDCVYRTSLNSCFK